MMMHGLANVKLENNIKMDHQEVRWGGIHCNTVAQDRDGQQAVVNAALSFWVS
jgi:hypothetical protein